MRDEDWQSLLQTVVLAADQPDKALCMLMEAPNALESIRNHFGPTFVEFESQYDSLPRDELMRQYLFNMKFQHEAQYRTFVQNAIKRISPKDEMNRMVQSSQFDGQSINNISISVFGTSEKVKQQSFVEKHSVAPNQEIITGNGQRSSLNNSTISTTVYSQNSMKPRSKSANSLHSVLQKTKDNEIERIKLNKKYTQLNKELDISEKAIKQSQQQYQDIFKQIRQFQQLNINLQKKHIVSGVAEQSGNSQLQAIENKIISTKKQLQEVNTAITEVTQLNEDYKLQAFGQGQVDKLNSMYQQIIATTEENVFIASKEDQVVIYQEIMQNDEQRVKLTQKKRQLLKAVKDLESELENYQQLISAKQIERSQL